MPVRGPQVSRWLVRCSVQAQRRLAETRRIDQVRDREALAHRVELLAAQADHQRLNAVLAEVIGVRGAARLHQIWLTANRRQLLPREGEQRLALLDAIAAE